MNSMEGLTFFTEEFLMTFAGQVTLVTLLTEGIKLYINKFDPKIISLILSVGISLIAQLVFKQDYSVNGIILSLCNSIIVLLSSIGGYETVLKGIQRKIENNALDKEETNYTMQNEEE